MRSRVVLAVLVAVVVLVPMASAVPEQFFIFQPDPETTVLEQGDGLRVCAVQPVFVFAMAGGGFINVTKPSGAFEGQETDSEDCVSFLMNETGRYRFTYPEDDLNGFTSRNATLFVGDRTQAVNNSGSVTVEGFETFDQRVPELLWLTLTILAFFNGWIFAGGLFLVAGVATQTATGFETFTYRWGYVLGLAFLCVELLAHKYAPLRRLRERLT